MLDVADLMVPAVTFLVARRDGVALGCAALARREGYAEIKRMWVTPDARGLKLGPPPAQCAGRDGPQRSHFRADARSRRRTARSTGPLPFRRVRNLPRTFGDYPEGAPSVFMAKRVGMNNLYRVIPAQGGDDTGGLVTASPPAFLLHRRPCWRCGQKRCRPMACRSMPSAASSAVSASSGVLVVASTRGVEVAGFLVARYRGSAVAPCCRSMKAGRGR